MRGLRLGMGVGLLVACVSSGQAVGEESAAEAIRAFGLVGIWSINCAREPIATCSREQGCGARTVYEAPPSGPPMIWNVVGTLTPGAGKVFETTIESAVRIADDKLKIITIQQGVPGETFKVAWFRQPGERWEIVLLKLGDKYRIFSAWSEDGKKISAGDGYMYLPPPDTTADKIPTNWVRSEKETPPFEKCGN
jgi:hypothetical protein